MVHGPRCERDYQYPHSISVEINTAGSSWYPINIDNSRPEDAVISDDEIITITDPDRLRDFGWKDPLPQSSITAARSLWKQWRRRHKTECYVRVQKARRELRKFLKERHPHIARVVMKK
jgi:hypothetical protein